MIPTVAAQTIDAIAGACDGNQAPQIPATVVNAAASAIAWCGSHPPNLRLLRRTQGPPDRRQPAR